jgi:hypothetical protein
MPNLLAGKRGSDGVEKIRSFDLTSSLHASNSTLVGSLRRLMAWTY